MAYSPFLLVPLTASLGTVLLILYRLLVNYNAARGTGLPIIVLPVDCGNPLWLILDRKIAQWVRRSPVGSGTFTRFNWRGWEIWDRYHAHQELGDAILFVTPGKNYLQLCDAEAVSDIFQRRADFLRPPESTGKIIVPLTYVRLAETHPWLSEMLNIFGPNVGTTDGTQWQRHRKITASSLNEQVNQRVWMESIIQSTGLIHYWSSKPSITSVAADTRTVSLHVMSGAIFGKSYPFRGADEEVPTTTESSLSYGEALKTILDRCIPLVVLGRKNLSKPWLPKSFRELYQATRVFQDHMTQAYEGGKKAMMRDDKLENNLMTSLVRASLVDTDQKGRTTGSHQEGLTEEEVYGNVFVFNFAGHDATANSLAIGICLLATRPDLQDWIAEEINTTLTGVESKHSSYGAVFPRLPRCLAVVYETVRLYTAVAIAKSTGSSPQSLKLGDKTVLIPRNTVIIPNYSALHTHPRYWGDDSLEFEPSRWITHTPTTDRSPPSSRPVEHFKEPTTRNSPFVGWSGGARSCPGRKFAQVEFVGVLVGLFRDFRVRPVPFKGEDEGMARARLLHQIRTDTGMRLLLQMLHPERAVLEWKKR
ncbi:MAG: hypothetical protein LQ345_000609 [Seirophora villosa]|nr:MAG: hypothetical protein LQ345_000609 [Seirophora villosa]